MPPVLDNFEVISLSSPDASAAPTPNCPLPSLPCPPDLMPLTGVSWSCLTGKLLVIKCQSRVCSDDSKAKRRPKIWKLKLEFKSFFSLVSLGKSPDVLFFLIFFYWSIVDLQYCVNFCCTAKWFSYTYIYSFLYYWYFPLWFIIGYWIYFSVLYSRTLLFIHSMYNHLHLLTPTSDSTPSLTPSPLATTSLFSMSVSLFLFQR